MTQVFSDMVLQQVREHVPSYDFRSSAKLFAFLHPQVLRSMLSYLHDPDHMIQGFHFRSWNLHGFATSEEALSAFPSLVIEKGTVANFAAWMEAPKEVAFDFESLGFAVFSETLPATEMGLATAMLSPWFSYATSPELWGPQGKWTRFHSQLETLFEKYGLMKGKNRPGLYLLSPQIKKLEKFGFLGDDLGDVIQWSLPWTFPLSGLKELEVKLSQEF
jgi:hypothetical protein